MLIVLTIILYFVLLTAYSHLVVGRRSDNNTFYRGNRQSPWYLVAFGMIGASISGVTFVSVPGMVNGIGMTYMQTCLGFIIGYLLVAFVLLPLYYRYDLTTIYSFLDCRLGAGGHKTGAACFLLSKMTGAAVRFYVVCFILQRYVLDAFGIPFPLTVCCLLLFIWLYTRRGGIKTLVWTDSFQTLCMLVALCLIVYGTTTRLGLSLPEAVSAVCADERSRWFVFDDWVSKQNFFKQFLSGIFIVIVMTGLDQDMMQKNLTCRSLRDAQKDMCTYGLAFVPVNLLFLFLGVLLSMLAQQEGLDIPAKADELLPMFAATGRLGEAVVVFFTIGILAASFSSADSALTSMTTTYCVDIKGRAEDVALRKRVHIMMCVVFALIIFMVNAVGSNSAIDAIYTLCSYTYGPLLGLFAYAMTKKKQHTLGYTAFVAVLSPVLCFALECVATTLWDYHFGYELLMLNGAITFTGLWIISKK